LRFYKKFAHSDGLSFGCWHFFGDENDFWIIAELKFSP